jgi:hypothetical protein
MDRGSARRLGCCLTGLIRVFLDSHSAMHWHPGTLGPSLCNRLHGLSDPALDGSEGLSLWAAEGYPVKVGDIISK